MDLVTASDCDLLRVLEAWEAQRLARVRCKLRVKVEARGGRGAKGEAESSRGGREGVRRGRRGRVILSARK